MNGKFSLPKSARLLSKNEFRSLYARAACFHGQFLAIHYEPGQSETAKLGITVSKRFGKAHLRNRFKRLVRESFRLHRHALPTNLSMNVLPKTLPAKRAALDIDFNHFIEALSSTGQAQRPT